MELFFCSNIKIIPFTFIDVGIDGVTIPMDIGSPRSYYHLYFQP